MREQPKKSIRQAVAEPDGVNQRRGGVFRDLYTALVLGSKREAYLDKLQGAKTRSKQLRLWFDVLPRMQAERRAELDLREAEIETLNAHLKEIEILAASLKLRRPLIGSPISLPIKKSVRVRAIAESW